jgi:hypothetical protein
MPDLFVPQLAHDGSLKSAARGVENITDPALDTGQDADRARPDNRAFVLTRAIR